MAGEFSTVGANNALDGAFGRVTQTARTVYVALLSAAPTDATTLATMTEITATGYSRQVYTPGAPTGDPAVTSNTNSITFGPFTADPPSVGWCALVSAASGTAGDFIYWWTFTTARDAAIGDSLNIAVGALSASLD
jgi:hypothetical protein